MKFDRKFVSGIVGLAALVSSSNAAEMSTIPENNIWVADGVTQNRLDVHLDNSGLNGERTEFISWNLSNPNELTFVDAYLPQQNDFFEGIEMLDELNRVVPPGQDSIRDVSVRGSGPLNRQGIIGTYQFIVPEYFVPGQYSFTLTNDTIYGGNYPLHQQPHNVVNVPFTVVAPRKIGDANCDGLVNNFDIGSFVIALTDNSAYQTLYPYCNPENTDINSDGNLNAFDIDPFVSLLVGN